MRDVRSSIRPIEPEVNLILAAPDRGKEAHGVPVLQRVPQGDSARIDHHDMGEMRGDPYLRDQLMNSRSVFNLRLEGCSIALRREVVRERSEEPDGDLHYHTT